MSEKMNRMFGSVGSAAGLLAILLGALHFFLGPIEPALTVESFVEEQTRSIKDALVSGLNGEIKHSHERTRGVSRDQILNAVVITLGVLALALGVFAFIRREDKRASAAAMTLGVSAILIQYAVALAGALIVAIIIAAIIGAVTGAL